MPKKKAEHICNCGFCLRTRHVNEVWDTGDMKKIRELINELEEELLYAEGANAEIEAKLNGNWPGTAFHVAEVMHNLRQEHLGISMEVALTDLPDYTKGDALDLCNQIGEDMSKDHAEHFKNRMISWENDPRYTPVKSMMIAVRAREDQRKWKDSDQTIIDAIATVLFTIPLELIPEHINHDIYGFYAKWRLEVGK